MSTIEKTKTSGTKSNTLVDQLRNILISQEGVLFVIMVVSVLFLATRTDKFLTVDNLLQQGRFMT
ncbi:MAG: hypothetical protein CUN57_01790, partial [Phototrophicales bacterium]